MDEPLSFDSNQPCESSSIHLIADETDISQSITSIVKSTSHKIASCSIDQADLTILATDPDI
jgi:predicted nuclease with TOPRIM domain